MTSASESDNRGQGKLFSPPHPFIAIASGLVIALFRGSPSTSSLFVDPQPITDSIPIGHYDNDDYNEIFAHPSPLVYPLLPLTPFFSLPNTSFLTLFESIVK
jgi:hypothetical protein